MRKNQYSEFLFWLELKIKSTNKVVKKFRKCIYVSCRWNRLPNSGLLAVIEIFGIDKFRRFFSINNISSLNIVAVYM